MPSGCLRACMSCSTAASHECPLRPGTSCSSRPRSLGRPSSWWQPPMATGPMFSRLSTPRRGKESSSSMAAFGSRTRCSHRSATSRRNHGSGAPFMGPSPGRSSISRSGRGTWRCRWRLDAAAASQLDAGAEQAAARGATAAAAELCELAAQLTPDDPGLARRRRIRSAGLYRLAGERERAVGLLEELLREIPLGVERADVLLELARTHRAHQPATIALLGRCADRGGRRRRAVCADSWRIEPSIA